MLNTSVENKAPDNQQKKLSRWQLTTSKTSIQLKDISQILLNSKNVLYNSHKVLSKRLWYVILPAFFWDFFGSAFPSLFCGTVTASADPASGCQQKTAFCKS